MQTTHTNAEAGTAQDSYTERKHYFLLALRKVEKLIEKEWDDAIESLPNDEIKEGKIRGLRIALDKIEQIQDSIEEIL